MKNICLLIAVLILNSCSLNTDHVSSINVKAKVHDEIVLDAFSIKVKSVCDSRCPEGCMCVWAGEAKVFFTIKEFPTSLDTSLTLPSNPAMIYKNYSIDLKSVNPYPICNFEFPDDYTIQFLISDIKGKN